MSELPPPPPPNMAPPPGYVAYASGIGATGGQLRPVKGVGKWLVILISASLVAQAALVLVQFTLKSAARDYLDGVITSSAFDDKLALYLMFGLLAGAVAVAQMVLLIIWTWRLAKNAQVLGRHPQSFKPGATIAINILGGCTLGILPFFMWRELWQASDPDVAPGDPAWKRGVVTALIPIHLAFTIAGVAAGIAVSKAAGVTIGFTSNGSRADLADRLNGKLGLIGLSGALGIAAAIVLLMIVKQLTARHALATREG